ncbi:MAG: MBL fold metallo-hydrolase [Clostridiales bacterium]|nr:MBL fold metallo-hydrolase [Clostridiales bacterium]
MAKTCQLFSGSSGNSIYISTPAGGVLVDIGVSARRCERALTDRGISPGSIKGVFITHEHTDHVCGLRVFASKYKVPVWADKAVIDKMIYSGAIDSSVTINEMPAAIDFGGTLVESFENSHDSAACLGYKFTLGDKRRLAVCTDTGYITDSARKALKKTDLVYLESNYEKSMLENGAYPYVLKKRIMSKKGHLSNSDSDKFAVELLESGTTHFVLSHLSRENNTPDIAAQSAVGSFVEAGARAGVDYRLFVSKPVGDGGMIIL